MTLPPLPVRPGALVVVLGPAPDAIALARRAAAAAVARSPRRATLLVDLTRTAALDVHLGSPLAPGGGLDAVLAAARTGHPAPGSIVELAEVDPAGHRCLRGVSHPTAWIEVRTPAAERALDAIVGAAPLVVAAADPDLEGEAETGSIDVEERHALARGAVARADAVAIAADRELASAAGARATAERAAALAAARHPQVVAFAADGLALDPLAPIPTIGALVADAARRARRTAVVDQPIAIRPGELGLASARPSAISPDRRAG